VEQKHKKKEDQKLKIKINEKPRKKEKLFPKKLYPVNILRKGFDPL